MPAMFWSVKDEWDEIHLTEGAQDTFVIAMAECPREGHAARIRISLDHVRSMAQEPVDRIDLRCHRCDRSWPFLLRDLWVWKQ
jgi:hypothetical protein